MKTDLIKQFNVKDALENEMAALETNPQVIYETKEIVEKMLIIVIDVIRLNEKRILRKESTGPKFRKLNIEDMIDIFKCLHGFDGPSMSLRTASKTFGISAQMIGVYNNRILSILKKNEKVKALRGE